VQSTISWPTAIFIVACGIATGKNIRRNLWLKAMLIALQMLIMAFGQGTCYSHELNSRLAKIAREPRENSLDP
jgi:hypothetical protein